MRDQGRLAGIRKADEADVRQQLELQPQIPGFTRLAGLDLPGSAIRGRREPGVAKSAAAPAGHDHTLAFPGEVGEQPVRMTGIRRLFVHERPDWDGQLQIGAGCAGAVRALAVLAAPCVQLGMEPVVDERVDMWTGDDVDRAAVTAVAAARPAARHEFLAAECEAAATAGPGFDVDVDFVDEQVTRGAGCG